jgi:DMSO reductase anchor subunit
MHPAFSVIVFTTISGIGYGLAMLLGLGALEPGGWSLAAHILAFLLISGGLLSSTLHLGNPQRAWRAFSQWRSSWLSREGVFSILTFGPLLLSMLLAWNGERSVIVGLLLALGALATVVATGMIYASLRSIRAWYTPLTPAIFVAHAISGGALLASVFAFLADQRNGAFLVLVAVVALAVAWGAKHVWRKRARDNSAEPTAEQATGLGHIGKVRLLEKPHVMGNYLTREMGFRVARKHAEKLFLIAVALAAALPLLLALLALAASNGLALVLLVVAVLSHLAGMMVERWLFFAEARHAVSSYYGQ